MVRNPCRLKSLPFQWGHDRGNAGSDPKTKESVLVMSSNGAGIRDTARTLNMSRNTVSKILRNTTSELVARNPYFEGHVSKLKIDEMQSFLGKRVAFGGFGLSWITIATRCSPKFAVGEPEKISRSSWRLSTTLTTLLLAQISSISTRGSLSR